MAGILLILESASPGRLLLVVLLGLFGSEVRFQLHLCLCVNILHDFIANFVISCLTFVPIAYIVFGLHDRYGLSRIAHPADLRPGMVLVMRLVLKLMGLLHLLC